jgi:hypothetical protein
VVKSENGIQGTEASVNRRTPLHFGSGLIVAGDQEVAEKKNILVAGARYVPNTQLLSIPFRSELIRADYS